MIEIVPNDIDVDQIRNVSLPSKGDPFDMLFAGRLIADKDVSALLDAFSHVTDDYDGMTLDVVGDDSEADHPERQADLLDHTDRVSLFGFLDEYEGVLGQMRIADVFASPSTRERFGVTYVEAVVANCMIIGVQHLESTTSEVIGDTGYLAGPTVGSVVESLTRAPGGETPSTEPTRHAKRYGWDSVADQVEKAYERAIDGRW